MSQSEPLVSITIVTFNQEAHIRSTLESCLGQTYSNLEVIVVNDGSTDKTEAEILQCKDPRIVYVYQANQGVSGALNTAIGKAKGTYVAILGGDDLCMPDR